MAVEIKNRWTGATICTGETIREAVVKNYANLRAANLSDADLSAANLRAADLRDADLSAANLSDANLRDVKNLRYIVPVIENIHQTIYEAASQPDALGMSRWHSCSTTHCRAGWTIVKAGEGGRILESCIGTNAAAALIYVASDPTLERVPNFFASNEQALEDMKAKAEQERERLAVASQ